MSARVVHFVRHMFTLSNQRTKKAFCNLFRCLFLFMKTLVGTRDEWMLPKNRTYLQAHSYYRIHTTSLIVFLMQIEHNRCCCKPSYNCNV